MWLVDVFRRLTGTAAPERIPTKLTAAEAIALAKCAAGDEGLGKYLNVATPERDASGAVIWYVRNGGVGAFLRLVVDDATGAILDRKEYHGR